MALGMEVPAHGPRRKTAASCLPLLTHATTTVMCHVFQRLPAACLLLLPAFCFGHSPHQVEVEDEMMRLKEENQELREKLDLQRVELER